MGKGGFFYLFFPFPVGRADAVNSFAEEGSYASAFCFVVFYGCASVFGGEDVNVVSRFEMDVFGMYGAAFDGYVFFWFFCMSLAFIPACRAYRAFSRPSPTSPALFTGAAMSLAALSIDPNILSSLNKCMTILIIAQSLFYAKHDPSLFPVPLPLLSLPALFLKNFPSINYAKFLSHPV